MRASGRSNTGSQVARIARLELVDARALRHPARLDVQHRDALVVALEEREEVLREVVLVVVGQRADDAEVDRDVAIEVDARVADVDVAGVHVGVEEAVLEHLREEDLDAVARQLLQVDAGRAAAGRCGRSGCPTRAPSRSRPRCSSPRTSRARAAASSRRSCGAAGCRWPPRASGRARRAGTCRTPRRRRAHAAACRRPTAARRAPPASAAARGRVRSRDACPGRSTLTATSRRRPSASALNVAKCTCAIDADATGTRSNVSNSSSGALPSDRVICRIASSGSNGGTRSCSRASSFGVFGRQQVAPRRQHLAELDEDRAERLERLAQPLRARRAEVAAEAQVADRSRQHRHREAAGQDLVETVAPQHARDDEQPEDLHQSGPRRVAARPAVEAPLNGLARSMPGSSGGRRASRAARDRRAARECRRRAPSRRAAARAAGPRRRDTRRRSPRAARARGGSRPTPRAPAATSRCDAASPTTFDRSSSTSQRRCLTSIETACAKSASPSTRRSRSAASGPPAIARASAAAGSVTVVSATAVGAARTTDASLATVSRIVNGPTTTCSVLPTCGASCARAHASPASRWSIAAGSRSSGFVGRRPNGGSGGRGEEGVGGRHRSLQSLAPSCSATTPAARLNTRTRSKPASPSIAASVAWSGCMRIDSAR